MRVGVIRARPGPRASFFPGDANAGACSAFGAALHCARASGFSAFPAGSHRAEPITRRVARGLFSTVRGRRVATGSGRVASEPEWPRVNQLFCMGRLCKSSILLKVPPALRDRNQLYITNLLMRREGRGDMNKRFVRNFYCEYTFAFWQVICMRISYEYCCEAGYVSGKLLFSWDYIVF